MTVLVGTSLDDETIRLTPGDASHTIDEATGATLDAYCYAMQQNMYPQAAIVWEAARLDNDVVVVHCFDAGAGVLYRTFQPALGGGWEVLNAFAGDQALAIGDTLRALAQRGLFAHHRGEPLSSRGPAVISRSLTH